MSPRETKARAMLAEHGCVEGFGRPMGLAVGRRVIVDPDAIVNAMLDFAQQERNDTGDLCAAANEALVAFAEGVEWDDEKRAAYEALAKALFIPGVS